MYTCTLYVDFPYRYTSLVYNNPEADIVNILTSEYHMTQTLLGLETWGRSLLLFQHPTSVASAPTSSTAYTTTDLREPNHTPSLLLPLTSSDAGHSHVPEHTEITREDDATIAVTRASTSNSDSTHAAVVVIEEDRGWNDEGEQIGKKAKLS